MAMGVFQVADGIAVMGGRDTVGALLIGFVFAAMVAAYVPALLIDLGQGMARLSNAAMLIAVGLVAYTVVLGPTEFLLNSVVQGFGDYVTNVIPRGFQTYTFFGSDVAKWFSDWTPDLHGLVDRLGTVCRSVRCAHFSR